MTRRSWGRIPGRIALCSLVAVWSQFYIHFIFFLHLFVVSTITLTHNGVNNGTACRSYRNMGNRISACSGFPLHSNPDRQHQLTFLHCTLLVQREFGDCWVNAMWTFQTLPSFCHFTLDTLAPNFCLEVNRMVCHCLSAEISYFPPWDMASGK